MLYSPCKICWFPRFSNCGLQNVSGWETPAPQSIEALQQWYVGVKVAKAVVPPGCPRLLVTVMVVVFCTLWLVDVAMVLANPNVAVKVTEVVTRRSKPASTLIDPPNDVSKDWLFSDVSVEDTETPWLIVKLHELAVQVWVLASGDETLERPNGLIQMEWNS